MTDIVIVENDKVSLDYLRILLDQSLYNFNIQGFSSTVEEGAKLIASKDPELVFLDIHLDDGLGFELLDSISNKNFEVVFITAYDNYYEKAIEHFAFNYLLKPIKAEMLERVLKRYHDMKNRYFKQSKYKHFKEFIKENNSKILIQYGQNFKSIFLNNIVCCQADGNYTNFILKNDQAILANHNLKYYDDLLLPRGFFRANRSCLVNIYNIEIIFRKETLILSNGSKIPISARNRRQLNDLINTLNY